MPTTICLNSSKWCPFLIPIACMVLPEFSSSNFSASSCMFRSFIHLEVSLWKVVDVGLLSFFYKHTCFEDAVFSLAYVFGISVKN